MNKGRKPVPVTYNGITYESVYDCAAAFCEKARTGL